MPTNYVPVTSFQIERRDDKIYLRIQGVPRGVDFVLQFTEAMYLAMLAQGRALVSC